jgi:hypothetical protein
MLSKSEKMAQKGKFTCRACRQKSPAKSRAENHGKNPKIPF